MPSNEEIRGFSTIALVNIVLQCKTLFNFEYKARNAIEKTTIAIITRTKTAIVSFFAANCVLLCCMSFGVECLFGSDLAVKLVELVLVAIACGELEDLRFRI